MLARPPRRWGRLLWPLLLLVLIVAAGAFYLWGPLGDRGLLRADAALIDLGAVGVGERGEGQTVTLRNDGARRLAIATVAAEAPEPGDGGEVVIDADGCSGRSLGPEAECSFEVSLRPRQAGPRRALVTITGSAANSPLEIAVVGNGIAPRGALDPAAVDFRSVTVGTSSAPVRVRLDNRGVGALEVESVLLEGTAAGEFALAAEDCRGRTLAAGEGCALEVTFSPRIEGALRASLRVVSNSVEAPPLLWLTGTGETAGGLRFAAEEVDFGTQSVGADGVLGGQRAERELRLVHGGSRPLTIRAVTVPAGGEAFRLLADGCSGRTLQPSDTCEVTVAFAALADGEVSTPLRVTVADSDEGPWIPLRGRGASIRLVASPESLDFGEVARGGAPSTLPLEVRNDGEGAVPLTLAVRGDERAAFPLASDGCGGRSLAAGESCRLEVAFEPRAEGLQTARLEVLAGEAFEIPLRGVGAAPSLALDPQRLDFGTLRPGEGRRLSVRLSNLGRAPLEVRSTRLRGGSFEVVGGDCSSALAAGASCRLEVAVAARTEGPVSGILEIVTNAGAPRRLALVATVTAPPRPGLAISPSRLDAGIVVVGERGAIRDLRIRNPGDGRLVIEELRLEGPQAGEFRLVPGSCEGAVFLAPGADCTVGLRFLPTSAGRRQATLRVVTNAGADQLVSLEGTGG